MDDYNRVGLWLCPGLKEADQLVLLQSCASMADCVSQAHRLEIHLTPESRAFLNHPDSLEIEKTCVWLTEEGHHLIDFRDFDYPTLLKEIDNPPPFLSVMGQRAVLNEAQFGMVGCRNMTHYGAENAFQFAKALAEMGIGVTSGLARGVDALAHEGALAGGGFTIAVLGSGLNQLYPAQHQNLANTIAEQGAVVSEFPLNCGPMNYQFPMRNRIISGLSLGVLVVEAAQKSGSLITARCALRQNREVFAIPGSIHSPMSKGCHALLKDGATLVESIPDLLKEVQLKLKNYLHQSVSRTAADVRGLQAIKKHDNALKKKSRPGVESALLAYFKPGELIEIDDLAEKTGSSVEALSTELLMLELAGVIQLGAGGYIRNT